MPYTKQVKNLTYKKHNIQVPLISIYVQISEQAYRVLSSAIFALLDSAFLLPIIYLISLDQDFLNAP